MKSLLTVSGVVFAHICVFLLLVNGCQGSSGADNWRTGDTSIYSGGARSSADAPAVAEPVEADSEDVPATAVPADEDGPAVAEPAPSPEKKPTPGTQTSASDEKGVYKVKKGDTLSMIAVRNGITAKELADANGIKLSSTLRIGQTLKIPAAKPKTEKTAAAPAAEGEIYVVQKGDTLGGIALKNKTTVANLKKANNLKSDVIRVGQKLVIPGKASAKKPAESAAASEQPAETKPAAESEKKAPAEDVPAAAPEKEEPADESGSVAIDDDFGMPEGGFGQTEDVPAASEPAESEPAPAEPVPAAGTPAE